jgi:hypothetical protein
LNFLGLGISEVVHEDLLGERQRPAEASAADGHSVGERGVHAGHEIGRRLRSHSHVALLWLTQAVM